jgi:hypothetical protein
MRRALWILVVPLLACPGTRTDDPGDATPIGDADVRDADPGDLRCPDGVVMIDFPCWKQLECIDRTRYHAGKTMWCEDLGYDPECCGGATCQYLPDGECADDEVCVPSDSGDDRCLPKDCGGALGAICPGLEFCDLPTGECDVAASEGICTERPAKCGDYPCDTPNCPFECGCDGRTYGSRCERLRARVSLFEDGPCCDPSRIAFALDNPQGFDRWEACLPVAWTLDVEWVQSGMQALAPGATCARGVAESRCPAEGISCRGALEREPGSTRVTADSWYRLCRLAGAPFVVRIEGLGGTACPGPLGDVPYCDTPCTDPCGCRACSSGEGFCDATDRYLSYQCLGGCWSPWNCRPDLCDTAPDDPSCGQACGTINGDSHCWPDCPKLDEWWTLTVIGGYGGCDTDTDCHVLKGGCEAGLPGPCWIAKHVNVDEWQTDGVTNQWLSMGCTGPTCTCTTIAPTARCDAGTCVLVGP